MRSLFLWTALLAALLWCGCSTVREARAVQRNEPKRRHAGEFTMPAVQAGVKAGSTLTLAELEQIALKCNPAVRQADLAAARAMLALSDARSGYWPTSSLSAGHQRSTHNTNPHRETTRNTGNYNGSLSFNILIYDFGETAAAVRSAQEALSATEEQCRAARLDAVYNVRRYFFALKRAFDLHQVAVEAVQQYKEHLDQVKAKFEVGTGLSYDVTKAEVDYNQALLTEITAANTVQVGWANLNQALGLAENPEYKLGDWKLKEYGEDTDALMKTARAQSPRLKAIEFQIAGASADLDKAIAALYPTFSLSFSGSVSGHDPGLPWLWNLALGLTGTANLFNGGRDMRAIEARAIALRVARSQYAEREQAIFRNLREAVLTMQRARRQFEVAKIAEKSAKENLDIVNEKFNYGKASSIERTDAQVAHSKSKAEVVTARFDLEEAQAALANILGE